MLTDPAGDLFLVHFANIQTQVRSVLRLFGSIAILAVQSQEESGHDESDSLVTVNERAVPGDPGGICGRKRREVGLVFRVSPEVARSLEGRGEESLVPDAFGATVFRELSCGLRVARRPS